MASRCYADDMPSVVTEEDLRLLHRIRSRVIRNRHLVVGLSISMLVLTLVWVGFRLLYCWDVGSCGTSGSSLLCLLCRLDDVVRSGLLIAAFLVLRLLYDLFNLGGNLPEGGRVARVRHGAENLKGAWEPPKGSGPGWGTVLFAVGAMGISLYLGFSGFETYQIADFPPPAPIPETP